MFDDLRQFLKSAEDLDQCNLIEGANWDLEIGRITELQLHVPNAPLLLFDKIKGYKPGYRVVTNFLNTAKLVALAFGLPSEAKDMEIVQFWRDRFKQEFKPVPPIEVETGPVMQNIHIANEVDLFEFPIPRWAELDGGRYIGTADTVIMRDPDEGWVNLGTYRVQVHDKTTATVYIVPGRQGHIIRRKYWDKGLSCPVAVVCGGEPLLWFVSHSGVQWGVSEYDYAGWLRNKPVEVIRGKATGLPIPATAEIVLEGELVPPGGEMRTEGPFAEYTAYYATGATEDEPVFKVKSVLHRNDPVILGAPPQHGPFDYQYGRPLSQAAKIWDELDKQFPGVKGVWLVMESKGSLIMVISIEQRFGGHAKQVAMVAAGCYPLGNLCRFVILVDDDIDPSNMSEVLWAMATRCDPATSLDIMRDCWGTPVDPRLTPEKRRHGDFTASRAIIDACKPYHWMKDFPPSSRSSPEALKKTKEKWGKVLYGHG